MSIPKDPDKAPNDKGSQPAWFSLKEVVAASLSIPIVWVSLYILYQTFQHISDAGETADMFRNHKDILILAISLLGTVTGYYLGRVPAEIQADAARSAQKKAEDSEKKLRTVATKELEALRLRHRELSAEQSRDQLDADVAALLRIME